MVKKIHRPADSAEVPSAPPLCDWAGHTFTFKRTHYVLAANATSRLAFFFAGRGLTNERRFLRVFTDKLRERHEQLGLSEAYERFIEPSLDTVTWSKVANPSLLGAMNEYIRLAKGILEVQDVSCEELSLRMGRVPMGPPPYVMPTKEHQALCTIRLA
jgi:hypothetical protein